MRTVSGLFRLISAVSLLLAGCSPGKLFRMEPEEYVNYALYRYGTEVSAWWPRPLARSAEEERLIAKYGPEREDVVTTLSIGGADSTRAKVLMRLIDGDVSPDRYWEWYPGKIVEIKLLHPQQISRIVIYTVREPLGGFALKGYYVRYYDESGGIGGWKLLTSTGRAKSERIEHRFPPVKTDRIRLEMSRRGDVGTLKPHPEYGTREAVYAKLVEVELLGPKPPGFDERKLMAEAVRERRKRPEEGAIDTYGIFFPIGGDTVKVYRGGYSSLSRATLDTLRRIEVIDTGDEGSEIDGGMFSFSSRDGSMDIYDIGLGSYISGRREIDISEASSSLRSGNLVMSMRVRGAIVSAVAGFVSKGYDYGFSADLDSDGAADFEAHYRVRSSHPEIWGEISDGAGRRYSILKGISTYVRGDLLEMRVPLRVLLQFRDISSFKLEAFARLQDLIDVCPDANLEARYRKDLRSR